MLVKIPSGNIIFAIPPFFMDLTIHSVKRASIPLPPDVYALVSVPYILTDLLASLIAAL